MRPALPALTLCLAAAPLLAQDMPDPAAMLDGAADLAADLGGRAADSVLLADSLGAEVIGPDGEPLGTVADFVVLPGGNLVAAVIERPDGGRLALPWEAVQAGIMAGRRIELPMTGAEIEGAAALGDLTAALGL